MLRKLCRLGRIIGITGIVALALWPYHDGALRYGLPMSIFGFWSSVLISLWPRRVWRLGLLVLPILASIPFLLPGKPFNQPELREHYVAAMRSFEGTRYLWGGEGGRGVGCVEGRECEGRRGAARWERRGAGCSGQPRRASRRGGERAPSHQPRTAPPRGWPAQPQRATHPCPCQTS